MKTSETRGIFFGRDKALAALVVLLLLLLEPLLPFISGCKAQSPPSQTGEENSVQPAALEISLPLHLGPEDKNQTDLSVQIRADAPETPKSTLDNYVKFLAVLTATSDLARSIASWFVPQWMLTLFGWIVVLTLIYWLRRPLRWLFRPLKRLFFGKAIGVSMNTTQQEAHSSDEQILNSVLLPGQRRIIRHIFNAVDELDPRWPGRMLGLHGVWGAGKSYIVQALENFEDFHEKSCANQVAASPKRAVVRINIWEQQREPDLHFAIVRAVLAHPKIFECCFDAYPWRILFAPVLNFFGHLLPKSLRLNLNISNVALSAEMSIPMVWQNAFKAVVRTAVSRNIRLVVVLDEIDRAEPALAQAAITLGRRALDLPGVLVVLPYVEEQLRYKVFHPLNMVSPDLRGTMEAVLNAHWERLPEEARKESRRQLLADQDVQRGTADRLPSPTTLERLHDQHITTLVALYQEPSSDALPEQLYQAFCEKYLSWNLPLEGLTPEDLACFLLESHTVFRSKLAELIAPIIKEFGSGQDANGHNPAIKEAFGLVSIFISEAMGIKIKPANVSLRKFEGSLDGMLCKALPQFNNRQQIAESTADSAADLNSQFVFVVMLVTMVYAWANLGNVQED
ncbi:MAG: hypothetical protein ACD_23C00587G0003 [uncultured bacterium]|nr:MAG: hypothetical protein ACD_23C00587G0003 [uncultured bacterium]